MALVAARRGRQMTCVLSSRGGAVVAGGATARRDRSVTEGSRRPRRSAMALIAACRGRQMTWVLSSRGGAVMAGIATAAGYRSEEHTSQLQSLMRISFAVL